MCVCVCVCVCVCDRYQGCLMMRTAPSCWHCITLNYYYLRYQRANAPQLPDWLQAALAGGGPPGEVRGERRQGAGQDESAILVGGPPYNLCQRHKFPALLITRLISPVWEGSANTAAVPSRQPHRSPARAPESLPRACPVCAPVRSAIYPWIATATQG